ncbi:MAG: hypothetical protein KAS32_10190 [Candidatus Peribacteraceae bacterium]|nr:hypothetical protein [Candidatus Peribacteraceae bacterium]
MKTKILWLIIGLSLSLLLAANSGGVGTFLATLSGDGSILVVVDSRTGAYKVRKVRPGDEEPELFNIKERNITNYKYRYHERD